MRIGVIHTAFIGDIVLTGLLIEALHRAGHEITFFTKPHTVPIYEHDTRVKHLIPLKKEKGLKKLTSFTKLVKQIRSFPLDALICPHKSSTTSLLAYFSGIKIRIGFKNAGLSSLYFRTVPYKRENHECIRMLELLPDTLCSTSIKNDLIQIGRPLLQYSPISVQNALKKINFDFTRPYAIVAMGSVWPTKKYTHEYFVEVCQNILQKFPNLNLVFTGVKSDQAECEDAKQKLSQFSSRVLNLAGEISLFQLLALISRSQLVISNDSSPTHIAGAFNVPNICFFGPTDIEFGFKPTSEQSLIIAHKTIFGQNLNCQPCGAHGAKKCPKKHHKCMKLLTPAAVNKSILHFIHQIQMIKND